MLSFLIWLLTITPSLLIHALLGIGIAGFVASFFMPDMVMGFVPTIQKTIVKYASIFILATAIFFEGGIAVNNKYLEEQKIMQQRIEIAEQQSRDATSKIEYVFQDRVQKIKDVQVVFKDRIRDISVNIDKDCKVTSDIINVHNSAAREVK